MKNLTNLLPALLLLFFTNSYAQQKATPLLVAQSINGELGKEDIDNYTFKVDANQFVFGIVNQISVDVVINVFDREGKKIKSFDNPAKGPEPFMFETKTEGEYRIEVESFEDKEGAYSIQLNKIEPVAKDPAKKVDQLLSAYDNEDTPGAVVGVVQGGKIIFSKGYGMANLTHDIPFTTNHVSNIGSVSKQFTAMAILLLEKEGKLKLTDDVRKHIPELPDLGETITLKNLLNHTNGFREIYNTMPLMGWKGEDGLRREEAVRLIQRQTELQAVPGEVFNYNNTAFIMLAEIVERITEESFPKWMKKHVFAPLGMDNTMVRPDPAQIVPKSTQGYTSGEHGFQEAGDLDAAYGAGGIYTTIADLNKWLINFKTAQLGGKELMEKLITPDTLNNGDTMTYALGIGVSTNRGLKKYQHTGGDIAHRALLAYYPELDAGIITMSNNASYNLGVGAQIADAFFGDQMGPKEDAKKEETSEVIEVVPAILKSYVGEYKMEEAAFIIEYKFEDNQLVAYPQGQPSLALTPLSDSSFTYEGVEAKVVFHTDNKEVNSATHHQGGGALKMKKLAPYAPTEAELTAYTGNYYSLELQTFYQILLEDNELVARHINMEDIKLKPISENEFSGSAFFFAEIKFELIKEGKVMSFLASNGRTKNVRFIRQSKGEE